MLRDPVSNPIRWLMLVSAICLVIFLFSFTSKSISYIDYVDQQSEQIDRDSIKIKKKNYELKKLKMGVVTQGLDEP